AGLALFFIATMLWFLTSSMRGGGGENGKAARFAVRLAVTISVVFVLIAGVVLFGHPILQRFGGGSTGVAETLATDARLRVYAEAAPIAADHPMMGLGLGNFSTVFALLHHLPNAYTRFRHPESDWLWFLCEAGWPATFALLVGIGFLIGWMEPWKPSGHKKGRRERRLRRAAGLAFLLSIGHGVMDTPNHDLPQLLLVILLAALALRRSRMARGKGVSVPWLFRLGGAGALAASGVWFATSAGVATPFGQSVAENNILQARLSLQENQPVRALTAANLAIAAAPAAWEPYFLRAQAALKLGHPESEAMADFGRARHLEPHVIQKCMEEAATWLLYAPANALPPWREALQRDPIEAKNTYRRIIDSILPLPELRPAVRDLADRPSLLVIYLTTAPAAEVEPALQLLLRRYPSLEGMTGNERQAVISRWQNYGDPKKLGTFLELHPALDADTWQIRAQLLANDGKLEAAFKLLQQYIHPPAIALTDASPNLPQLERDFLIHPSDAKRGLSLYVAQHNKGLWDAALATLEQLVTLPTRPRRVYFDMASLHAQKGDYAKAWQLAQQYLATPE
ncbi:MAG: O-antigen polymerase, partial [Verrucomicrobiaceae bacterium]|nr:O-antigen polymerase [Verrucomicrobiaceae bacterium]